MKSFQNINRIAQYLCTFIFYKRFFLSFIFIFLMTSIINNLYYLLEIYKLKLGWDIFFSSLFDFSSFDNVFVLSLYIFSLILISLNMSLFLKFVDNQKSILDKTNNKVVTKKESFKNILFIFFSILFFHCASCGLILFGGLVSFSSSLFFAKYNIYIQILFILFICVNIYYNFKKIQNPFIC